MAKKEAEDTTRTDEAWQRLEALRLAAGHVEASDSNILRAAAYLKFLQGDKPAT